MKILLIWVVIMALVILGLEKANAKQTQPDPKRVRQIQIRLVEHGYSATTTWKQAQEVCRSIARAHGWQTHRAPDARVLILLGLDNEHSDRDILEWPENRLDYKAKE